MHKLRLADVLNFFECEKAREARRREVIDLKRVRRVPVGRYLSFVGPGRGPARVRRRGAVIVAATLLALAGCGREEPSATPGGPGNAERGRQMWLAQCVACHNADPAKDGPLGPAVRGASAELLEARVVRATYPPGYKPKRDSKVMPARPDLAAGVPDLAAYLR
jgi:mono/diheme cytochrome c family protein